MFKIIDSAKKEVILKVITSLFLQGLLLIIPIFWSNTINHVSEGNFHNAYFLSMITLLLGIFYYIWSYLNQKSWYMFYNKIYIELTKMIERKRKLNNVTLGEYTNILNNDIDIIGTVFGNLVTRVIQVLELLIIYIYFLSLNFYIFLISIIMSFFLVLIIIKFNGKIEYFNSKRKECLDIKSIEVHDKYNILKKGKPSKKSFIESTYNYLKSNTLYNIFVMSIIYIILGIINIAQYLIVIYGIYLVSLGDIEIGTVLLIYSYYSRMITDFEVLATVNADLQSAKVSYKRIRKIES